MSLFERNTMGHCYNLIGWYDNIRPENRSSSNISDGTFFRTKKQLLEYARVNNFTISHINTITLTDEVLETNNFPME